MRRPKALLFTAIGKNQSTFFQYSATIIALTLFHWFAWTQVVSHPVLFNRGSVFFLDLKNFYLPTSNLLFNHDTHTLGYMYPPLFGLILFPLHFVPPSVVPVVWGAFMILIELGIIVLVWEFLKPIESSTKWLTTCILTLGYPASYNFFFGQISDLLLLCCLLGYILLERKHFWFGAIALAFAASVKPFIGILAFYPLVRYPREFIWRFSITMFAVCFGLPSLVLGPTRFLSLFVAGFQNANSAMADFIRDPDSQYFFHLINRVFHSSFIAEHAWLFKGLGYLVVAANLGIVFRVRKCSHKLVRPICFILLYSSLPFFVPTSWPHYFTYLIVFYGICIDHRLKLTSFLNFPIGLFGWISMAMASLPVFLLFQRPVLYNHYGFVFFAALLASISGWIVLIRIQSEFKLCNKDQGDSKAEHLSPKKTNSQCMSGQIF